MDIDNLYEFIVLAKHLNFTSASRQLFIAQPTLSKHISLMEKELGVQLFIRTKHKVELTDAGHTLFETSKKIKKLYDDMICDINLLDSGQKGNIKLGMLYYGMHEFADPIVRSMSKNMPDIKLTLVSYQPKAMREDLLADKLDVAELYDIDFPENDQLSLQAIKWQYFSVMLPKDHALADRKEIRLSELNGENFVFQTQNHVLKKYICKLLEEKNIKQTQIFYTNHIDTVPLDVCANNAVSIVSRRVKYMINNNITFLDITDPDMRVLACFAYKKSNTNPCIPRFMNLVKNCFPPIECN